MGVTSQGEKVAIPLSASLNIDSVSQDIHQPGTAGPAILNNGIVKDGGLTELYESTQLNTGAAYVKYLSNGKRISLTYNASSNKDDISVIDADGITTTQIGGVSPYFFKRHLFTKPYYDVTFSSDNTLAFGLFADASGIYLDSISLATYSIITTTTITTSIKNRDIYNAAICKTNGMSANSIQTTSGIIAIDNKGGPVKYISNNVIYDTGVSTGAIYSKYQTDNLTAYYNGTTFIFCVNTSLNYNTVPGTYTACTAITAITLGLNFNTLLASAPGTITLNYCDTSLTAPVKGITITTLGVITTAISRAGLLYPSGGFTYNSAESAVVTLWGVSGLGKIGATFYSSIGPTTYSNGATDNTLASVPDGQYGASGNMVYGFAAGGVQIKTFLGNVAILTLENGLINDIGGGNYDTDIMGGLSTSSPIGRFWPPDIKLETVNGNGGWVAYKRNDSKFVICGVTKNNFISTTEISYGVVSINTVGIDNSIIDTNTYIGYQNLSCLNVCAAGTYTSVTASIAYAVYKNKYSSSLDPGLLKIDAAGISYYQTGLSAYDATGTYVGTYLTNIGIKYSIRDAGTYTYSPYVAPAWDVQISDGIATTLSNTAIMQPGFFGYQLGNLMQTKYQAGFILKGGYCLYDGYFIYSVPLPNGPASVMSGNPQNLVAAIGLQFLDASATHAYFLSTFDNSLWTFDGGRSMTKQASFCQKPAIKYGVFNELESALYLITESTIITIRDEAIITENATPFGLVWNTIGWDNTTAGVYWRSGIQAKIRTYNAGDALIPLNYQTAYWGPAGMQLMRVSRIAGRIKVPHGTAPVLTFTWNWCNQDSSGTDTFSFTCTNLSAGDYASFTWTPQHNYVLGASIGISTADTANKIVIMDDELVIYYTADSEAAIINTVL